MRGTIKAYSVSVNAGVIECDKGDTYGFRDTDWDGNAAPVIDERVRFEGIDRVARKVSSEK